MNKVSNLIKFYNRPTKEIIKDLTNGYSNYPFSFREMLKSHGNKIITSIIIVRSPISNILYQILNNLTLGQLEERLNDYNYDQLFHLKVIINNKYSIEKESTIKFTNNNHVPSNSETLEVLNIPNLTIAKLCENCLNLMGNRMFSYNAKNNNCQVFIRNLLEASGMYGNEEFIMQDIKQIFHGFTGTRRIMNTVTDISNRLDMITEGSGFIQKPNKLTTLTNSDLYSICIKLKLKLNGIYMKDEIPSDLKEGNYIINLENSNQSGSHWTCFVKDKNNVYYYDSFGVVMPQNAYDIFIKNADNIYYIDKHDQFLDSTSCGWWVVSFLYFMNDTKGNKLDIMKKFDKKFNNKKKYIMRLI
jgi:hypothetical protein